MTKNNKHFIEFSKPFVDAAKKVFETMVFSKLEPQQPYIKEGNLSKGDVSAILGVTGKTPNETNEYKAILVISWPYETYFKIASAMLMEEFTEYNEEISDLGAEICNMIMGNAKRVLAEQGYKTNMAIPSMVEGKSHSLTYPPSATIVAIPINSAHGQMWIEIGYTEE